MNRITPDQVKSAFNATGLIPIRGRSWDNDDKGKLAYGCGLFALALERNPGKEVGAIAPNFRHRGESCATIQP